MRGQSAPVYALDSIKLQSSVLLQITRAEVRDQGGLSGLSVDGRTSANNLLVRMPVDLLGLSVLRPTTIRTAALG